MDSKEMEGVLKSLTGAIVLSSDEEESCMEIKQPGSRNAAPAEVQVCPKEVLVTLHPETLEEVKISFVFFVDLPKKGQPTSSDAKIHLGSECMDFLSVNISNQNFIVKRGEPVAVTISFSLRPSAKKMMGIVATVTPRGSDVIVTRRNKDCVQMLLHLVSVDPECAAKISNQRTDVLAALHSTGEADFIVLFFVWIDKNQDSVDEKLAIACNKKKPFNTVLNALPFNAAALNCKLRFTNLKNKQNCHEGDSPESIALQSKDTVLVNICTCR